LIVLDRVTKRYEGRAVLDGVSAHVKKGEIVALVGPSGGGKTTLLRCLNGLESIDGGAIRVGAHELKPGGARANRGALSAIRQRAGFVFQQWHLFSHRTALANVIEAPVHVKRTPLKQALDRARALLARVGLGHREHALPRQMSGGEQQRAAIARALAMDPEVLLLDEPTSALDPERVGGLVELLRGLAADGLTMILVTHDISFAQELCTRAVVLLDGRIALDGAPRAVLDDPEDDRIRAFLRLAPRGDAAARAAAGVA
jgi:polar amino acid transport system ATP-binding protein